MRRCLAMGFGLAGLLTSSALAQLPSNQVPRTAGLPAGYEPAIPGQTALPPMFDGVPIIETPLQPAAPPVSLEIRTAIPPNHEWQLRPEHGAYFISVKSYARPSRPTADDQGPSALTMAEALAGEIRDKYRVQAFLYE